VNPSIGVSSWTCCILGAKSSSSESLPYETAPRPMSWSLHCAPGEAADLMKYGKKVAPGSLKKSRFARLRRFGPGRGVDPFISKRLMKDQ
jgi:hypothetical protein